MDRERRKRWMTWTIQIRACRLCLALAIVEHHHTYDQWNIPVKQLQYCYKKKKATKNMSLWVCFWMHICLRNNLNFCTNNINKYAFFMVHTTAETARGKEIPAKRTRKARSPMNFSPMSRKLARPLWTVAKTKRIINITNCKTDYQKI